VEDPDTRNAVAEAYFTLVFLCIAEGNENKTSNVLIT